MIGNIPLSLGTCLNRGYFRRIIEDFYGNAGLTYIGGFMALIMGALIVHFHNHWVSDWTLLITILGWLALIKGIVIIVFPKHIQRMSEAFLTDTGLKVIPYASLLLGLLFAYFGFVQGI
ncbi:MAG: hypothetical protein Q9M23_09000 [Mariprofundaceae bacterium]|nr:hypothetical protein [Mariprofundaceae bacterium]